MTHYGFLGLPEGLQHLRGQRLEPGSVAILGIWWEPGRPGHRISAGSRQHRGQQQEEEHAAPSCFWVPEGQSECWRVGAVRTRPRAPIWGLTWLHAALWGL